MKNRSHLRFLNALTVLGVLVLVATFAVPARATTSGILTTSLVPSKAVQTTVDGVAGASVALNNTLATAEPVLVYGSVLNQAGQVLTISVESSSLASHGEITYFFSVPVGTHGSYKVVVFATTTTGVALSSNTIIAVTV